MKRLLVMVRQGSCLPTHAHAGEQPRHIHRMNTLFCRYFWITANTYHSSDLTLHGGGRRVRIPSAPLCKLVTLIVSLRPSGTSWILTAATSSLEIAERMEVYAYGKHYGTPNLHEAIRRGSQASTSRRLEKCRIGALSGSATLICCVIARVSISASAG